MKFKLSKKDLDAQDHGFIVAFDGKYPLWATNEQTGIVIGPPRSGKGLNVVNNLILDAPGAVVTTSTRPENVAVTLRRRESKGPVAIFDPEGISRGLEHRRRWNLVRGCEDTSVAIARAGALGVSAKGVTDASFWESQAKTILRCLLHAAAVRNVDIDDLYRWSQSATEAREAVSILEHDGADLTWADTLASVVQADPRTRDSSWGMVSQSLTGLASASVREMLRPRGGDEVIPGDLIDDCGTLYLLGRSTATTPTANIVAALVEDVTTVAITKAAASSSGRLDPTLALVLDEAANYVIPSVPFLMSAGGGIHIATWIIVQNYSQMSEAWGKNAADAAFGAANVKIILGGVDDVDLLTKLSKLSGIVEVDQVSRTTGKGQGSKSISVKEKPRFEITDIREVPFGRAYFSYLNEQPQIVNLRPWTERSDAKQLRDEQDEILRQLVAGAQS